MLTSAAKCMQEWFNTWLDQGICEDAKANMSQYRNAPVIRVL